MLYASQPKIVLEWGQSTKLRKVRGVFARAKKALEGAQSALSGFVLTFFETVNRTIRSKLPFWRMNEETFEHVNMLIKTFKFLVLPASLLYIFVDFWFFRENAVDSMFWGILIFLYSNFLPDLPSAFRKMGKNHDLPWYKKYSLLLFAPIFIWLLLSGVRLGWKTGENFHNFRSASIYCVFLSLCGFVAFAQVPISIGDLFETLSVSLYGLTGYLAHLKVDKIW